MKIHCFIIFLFIRTIVCATLTCNESEEMNNEDNEAMGDRSNNTNIEILKY